MPSERAGTRGAGLVTGHWDYRDQLPLVAHVVGLSKGAACPLPPSAAAAPPVTSP